MDFRPGGTPAATTIVGSPEHSGSVAVEAEIPPAARNGASIARQTGHASLDSVEGYRREHAPLVGNAVNEIGLWSE